MQPNPADVTLDAGFDDDVAVLHVDLAIEQAGVWAMADRNEYAREIDVRCLGFVLGTADSKARDAGVITEHFIDDAVPTDIDCAFFLLFEQVALQDFFST